jgi:hypothetical protein
MASANLLFKSLNINIDTYLAKYNKNNSSKRLLDLKENHEIEKESKDNNQPNDKDKSKNYNEFVILHIEKMPFAIKKKENPSTNNE